MGMRIAETVCTFPPYPGGMGYACLNNSIELSRRGHEVTVFTLDCGPEFRKEYELFRVVRLRTPLMFGDAGIVPQLYPKLRGFDVIHMHFPFYGADEYVYMASLFRGQKYFMTYHSDVKGTTFLKKLALGAYNRILLKRLIKNATMVGALTMEHLRSCKVAGYMDWEKVIEMPNGVDSDLFKPRKKDNKLIEEYALQDKIVVLFVGNLYSCKGLDLLIKAVSGIRNDRVVLCIVGGGYSENEYRKQVDKMKLNNRVLFLGPKAHIEELPFYYNLADFLVLPSTESEAFPLVVLEAMASGKPVIVSSLTGPSQMVDDGMDGLITRVGDVDDLRDKIEMLAANEDKRLEMGMVAREKTIERYSWDKIGEKLEDALLRVAGT